MLCRGDFEGHPDLVLRVLKWDMPVMFAAIALLAWFAADGQVERAEGGLLLAAMVAYLGVNVRLGRRERKASALSGALETPHAASILGDVVRSAVGAIALAVGAQLLIDGALGLAATFGLAKEWSA